MINIVIRAVEVTSPGKKPEILNSGNQEQCCYMQRIEPAETEYKKVIFAYPVFSNLIKVNVHEDESGQYKEKIHKIPSVLIKPAECSEPRLCFRMLYEKLKIEMTVMEEKGNSYCCKTPQRIQRAESHCCLW